MCIERITYGDEEYRIKYIHQRQTRPATWEEYEKSKKSKNREYPIQEVALPKGGVTIAYIGQDYDNKIAEGIIECSNKDSYSKKFGRMIATGRLLKNLGLDTKLAL